MDNRTALNYSRYFLYATSLFSVLSLLAVISNALENILYQEAARDFVESMRNIPPGISRIGATSLTCLVLMLLLSMVIWWNSLRHTAETAVYAFVFLEIGLALVINYYLCCSYRNALYIAVSNIIVHVASKRYRLLLIVVTLVCYIAIDYNSIASWLIPYQLDLFIPYLDGAGNNWMTVKTVVFALNDLSFIYFCIVAVSSKEKEKQEIEALNNTLSQTISELTVTNVQLQEQVRHTEELAIYKERTRFSREMHDIIGHVLTGIVIGVEACQTLLETKPEQLPRQLDSILTLAKKGLEDIRVVIDGLRATETTTDAFLHSVERLVEDISSCTQMQIRLEVEGRVLQLGSIKETVVYRIIQESITNAVKHARARHMRVRLLFQDDELEVSIVNDGTIPERIREGFGIAGIRERVASAGGRLEISAVKDESFRLEVVIPAGAGRAL